MITFKLDIEPVAKGRPRFGKGFTYTDPKTRAYERDVKLLAKFHAPREPLTGPLKVIALFYMRKPKKPKNPRPIVKPDLDNLKKALFDALNGIMWVDDSQIVDDGGGKFYADKPGIVVQISEVV